jgi:outer membrane protein assembly factor BamB
MNTPFRIPSLILYLFFVAGSLHAQDSFPRWTHFRGSNLDGISSEKGLPISWNDSTNISWKTDIQGAGWSSPVVYGDRVWLTTATDEGNELRAICVDFQSGEIEVDRILFKPAKIYRKHAVNTYATPTSAIEQDFVYIHFGRYGTACLNSQTGETIWERTDMQCEHVQGSGSSLLLYKDKLIVHMEGTDTRFIYALNKQTGETIWRIERPEELYDHMDDIGKKAYITPIIVNVNGRDQMISNGSAACIAYDPNTGEEIWRVIQGEGSTISMPFESDGTVLFYTGFAPDDEGKKYAELLAVDPKGKGDITHTHVLWRIKSPILQLLTPVAVDGLLYTVDSKALLSCIDTQNGTTIWSEKLKGKYNSSPVYADGYIYINSTRGETFVYKAGKDLNRVSENMLEGEIWSTPAFTGGAILVRTNKYLYKVSKP